jgi:hypothetical protein
LLLSVLRKNRIPSRRRGGRDFKPSQHLVEPGANRVAVPDFFRKFTEFSEKEIV